MEMGRFPPFSRRCPVWMSTDGRLAFQAGCRRQPATTSIRHPFIIGTFVFGGERSSLTGKTGGALPVLEASEYQDYSLLASSHHWRHAPMS